MSKFRVPFTANIPIEKEVELNKEIETELVYERQREEKIAKTFQNTNSKLRRIADYLWEHLNQEISYNQISEELDIPESTVRCMVAELNFYKGFPITMMPVPKKAGYIQSVLENDEDYEKWDRKKMKTITSMNAVRTKADKITASKRKTRKKVKKEAVIKNES